MIIQRKRQIVKEKREESDEQTRDELHGCSRLFERGEEVRRFYTPVDAGSGEPISDSVGFRTANQSGPQILV
jgi:hypothetical protein